MRMDRDSVIMPRSFRDAVSKLPKEDRADAYDAFMDYALDGIEPSDNVSVLVQMAFDIIKPQIDAQVKEGLRRQERSVRMRDVANKRWHGDRDADTSSNSSNIEEASAYADASSTHMHTHDPRICVSNADASEKTSSPSKKENAPLSSPLSLSPTPPNTIPPIIPPKEENTPPSSAYPPLPLTRECPPQGDGSALFDEIEADIESSATLNISNEDREKEKSSAKKEKELTAVVESDQAEINAPKLRESDVIQIRTDWNARFEKTRVPEIKAVMQKRRDKIKLRIAEWVAVGANGDWLSTFRMLINKIAESDFCCGRISGKDGRQWVATFDWLIENSSNWVKLLEGNYDNLPQEDLQRRPTDSASEKKDYSVIPESFRRKSNLRG